MRASLSAAAPNACQLGPISSSCSPSRSPLVQPHALRCLHAGPRMQARRSAPTAHAQQFVGSSSGGGHRALYTRTEDELDGFEPWVAERKQDALRSEQQTQLRLFLDAATPQELEKWAKTGMFYGFTTNPTILKQANVPCNTGSLKRLVIMGLSMGYQEVQLQAWGPDLSATAQELASIDPRVVVKLPCTMEGIQAAALLREKGARATITGVYYPYQALVAQSVGASYIAPYLGRMGDAFGQEEGFNRVLEIHQMNQGCRAGLRTLVATIPGIEDVVKLATKGCNTFTITPEVASSLFDSPLTLSATGQFEADAHDNC